MARTAWGAEITYSFEIEGSIDFDNWQEPAIWPSFLSDRGVTLLPDGDLGVVNWFKTEEYDDAQWTGLYERSKKVALCRYMKNNKGTKNYASLQRLSTTPSWIKIEQEAWPQTWELNSAPPFATDPDTLFTRINKTIQDLSLTPRPVQVHIVFDEPRVEKGKYYTMLIGVWRLLNDYFSFKMGSKGNPVFVQRFVGPAASGLDETLWRIAKEGMDPDDLDRRPLPDQSRASFETMGGGSGHSIFKYNYVGFRETYGDKTGKIGFEIRGGWNRDKGVDRLKRIVVRIDEMLSSPMEHVHVKQKRQANAGNFSLEQHLYFINTDDNYDINDGLREKLKRTAIHVVKVRTGDRSPAFGAGKTSADNLYGRWMLAFLKWENHPALVSTRIPIASLREQMKQKLNAVNLEKETPVYVDNVISDFLKATLIHRYI